MRLLSVEVRYDEKQYGPVSVALERPGGGSDTLVIIAHGAGSTMEYPALKALQGFLVENGIAAARFNFAYAEAGKKRPDRAPLLEATWRAVADALRESESPRRLVLCGRSMGGRIASRIAADGYPCDGLVLLAYPLHPAGKPERLRSEHLPRIDAPMLFVQGTRDALCGLELLGPVLARLPRAELHVVEGGDHSFKVLKRSGRTADEVTAEIDETVLAWVKRTGRS